MLLGKNGGHENVHRVTQNLSLVIAKNPGQTGTGLQDLSDGLFVSTEMNDCSFITEDDIVRLCNFIQVLLVAQIVIGPFKINITMLLMVADVSQIFTIYIERILVVRIDLTQHIP